MSNKVEEAREILKCLGMPEKQQNNMCCYCLLALLGLSDKSDWTNATNEWVRIHDIIHIVKEYYDVSYAENSRETIRKAALHNFRNAAIIEDNGKATNSPAYKYRITEEALSVIRAFGKTRWLSTIETFKKNHIALIKLYSSQKEVTKKPVMINGIQYIFSSGEHNLLQKAILEEFAPRFAENSKCLYVGDSTNRDLVNDIDSLTQLGISINTHDKMPDVILYRKDKDWLYFIEAVTSVGPMSPKRLVELTAMTNMVTSGKIYITAFLDFKTYKKFAEEIAWETEIWIAEMPDHMIHMNGDKFLGPR